MLFYSVALIFPPTMHYENYRSQNPSAQTIIAQKKNRIGKSVRNTLDEVTPAVKTSIINSFVG